MKSIDKRVHDLRRDVEGTFNRYGFSLAVDELVLENILQAVRAQMQQMRTKSRRNRTRRHRLTSQSRG